MSQRPLLNRIWYRIVQRTLQILWVLIYRVRSTDVDNIPSDGPVLLLSNHQSHYDPPLIGCCCPRQTNYLARSGLFDFAPFGLFIRSVGAFPINNDGSGIGGIKETLRWLKRGEVVLMFPEGMRSTDGQIATFRPGFVAMARRCNVTLVPLAVHGAYDAWPRWRRFPGPGRLRVRFGKPMSPEQVRQYDEKSLVREVERRVRQCYAELDETSRHRSRTQSTAEASE